MRWNLIAAPAVSHTIPWTDMRPADESLSSLRVIRFTLPLIAAVVLAFSAPAWSQTAQQSFASAEEAAGALVAAAKARDRTAVLAVLGRDASSWIGSGDPVADRATVARFIAAYEAKHAIEFSGDKATLTIGENAYPFAFPIVKTGERWRFDTATGRDELLARRIGENELAAIEILRAIVDAQQDYASEDRNGDGILEYAQRLASTQGKRDGLYWRAKPGEAQSPLGPLVAAASNRGYQKQKKPAPFHGYHFRALARQGKSERTDALDYVVRGRAIGGFAVVAYPARYGNSGVMTFIVNHDGQVYERDLGPKTPSLAGAMRQFAPGRGWAPVYAR